MHTKKSYYMNKWIEREFHYAGRYGAKGEKREPRKNVTSEQIRRQNQWIRENHTRRLMRLNFRQGDLYVTLKYPAGFRPDVRDAAKDFKNFRRNIGRAYKKAGQPLKYIYRMEMGERGGIHIHMLVNRLWGAAVTTDALIEEKWSDILKKRVGGSSRTQGLADFKTAYEEGGFEELAEYFCKKPQKDSQIEGQLSLFDEPERKKLLAVQSSRNLIQPEPEVKKYTHWTMRRILENGPKPEPGYYIDPESIISGINPCTGLSYLYYTEIKIEDARGKPREGGVP